MKRRDFLRTAGMVTAGSGLLIGTGGLVTGCAGKESGGNIPKPYKVGGSARMRLSFEPYELKLRHTFTVATYSRTTTPDVQVKIEYDGFTGYGEASMPPYLGQTVESVCNFLKKVDLGQFSDPFQIDDILTYVDGINEGDTAAKAAVDIALHDLVGQLMGQPWYRIWGLNAAKAPDTTFTIGIDTPDVVREKTKECAGQFNILKVKVGLDNDKEMIETIREMFANYPDIKTEIIAASVRNPIHVTDCALAGADIATVPYKVLEQMTKHPLTDAGIEKFQKDYKAVFGE